MVSESLNRLALLVLAPVAASLARAGTLIAAAIDRGPPESCEHQPSCYVAPMLGASSLIAFVATVDGGRARLFYESLLGLRFVAEDDTAIVFDAPGAQLRIQKVQRLEPQSHTVLGWSVPSIDDAVRELGSRGIVFERYRFLEQDEHGTWTSPTGARVAWLKDPDGNVLSLTEPARG